MAKSESIAGGLQRLDRGLTRHRGRVGLMERWLQEHATRLDQLSGRIDASLARIEALLARQDLP